MYTGKFNTYERSIVPYSAHRCQERQCSYKRVGYDIEKRGYPGQKWTGWSRDRAMGNSNDGWVESKSRQCLPKSLHNWSNDHCPGCTSHEVNCRQGNFDPCYEILGRYPVAHLQKGVWWTLLSHLQSYWTGSNSFTPLRRNCSRSFPVSSLPTLKYAAPMTKIAVNCSPKTFSRGHGEVYPTKSQRSSRLGAARHYSEVTLNPAVKRFKWKLVPLHSPGFQHIVLHSRIKMWLVSSGIITWSIALVLVVVINVKKITNIFCRHWVIQPSGKSWTRCLSDSSQDSQQRDYCSKFDGPKELRLGYNHYHGILDYPTYHLADNSPITMNISQKAFRNGLNYYRCKWILAFLTHSILSR